jgi:NAD-dependent dihydropyrimidine dehydrogenase PreA subunit
MPIERVDLTKCNGCKVCIDACPMDVIRLDEATKKAVIKYRKDCIVCFNCEEDCPTQAIYVNPHRFSQVPPAW